MKVTAIVSMGFLLIGCGPLLAHTPPSNMTSGAAAVASQLRVAQEAEPTTSTTPNKTTSTEPSDSSGAEPKKPAHKKKTSQNHSETSPRPRSGAAVYKEGGKTCSGLDEYKVCW